MNFIIVSGLSGAGKTNAIKILEDAGYFCIDNLPLSVADKFIELYVNQKSFEKVAIVVDARTHIDFKEFDKFLEKLKIYEIGYKIIFFTASDEVLVKRFKESRRRHPIKTEGTILDDIKLERDILEPIKSVADIIIDTSELTVSDLKQKLLILLDEKSGLYDMVINLSSFGYKYGIPNDADIIFDVRFLPNPFYVNTLKYKTGLDKKVENYVLMWPNAVKFLEKFWELLEFVIPQYIKEGKKQLHISIGCTGGKHRSVVMIEKIAEKLRKENYKIFIKHRDIDKG